MRTKPTGMLTGTNTKGMHRAYWTAFDESAARSTALPKAKGTPPAAAHMVFSIDCDGFWIEAWIKKERFIKARVCIAKEPVKEYFRLLHDQKDLIEDQMGAELTWCPRLCEPQSFIGISKEADYTDRAQWPQQHAWLASKLEALYRVFSPRIQDLTSELAAQEPGSAS